MRSIIAVLFLIACGATDPAPAPTLPTDTQEQDVAPSCGESNGRCRKACYGTCDGEESDGTCEGTCNGACCTE